MSINCFSYCDNCPIVGVDPDGHSVAVALFAFVAIVSVAIVVRALRIKRAADKVNRLSGRKVIDSKQSIKAFLTPIPKNVLTDIEGHAKSYYGATVLFGYTDAPNHYVVYKINRTGSIIRWDYTYREYTLNREQRIFKAMDGMATIMENPTIAFPFLSQSENEMLTCMVFLWTQIRETTLPPDLDGVPTTIFESQEDQRYREGFSGLYN